MKRSTSSALALLPAFLLMAGKTTSVLAQQQVGTGTYNSPPNAPLLEGTGTQGNSPGYDAWSSTGKTGGTGNPGPSITQIVDGNFSTQTGSKSTGGQGGTGGTSIGNGGNGG